jgi:hypothetical protein
MSWTANAGRTPGAPSKEAIDMQPLEATRVPNTAAPPVPAPMAPPPAPHHSRLGRLTGSVALIAVGALAVADLTGVPVAAGVYTALPLAVVGAGLVVGGWYGRAHALIALGAVLSIALALTTAADRSIGTAGGTVTWRPSGFEQLDSSYRIGVGNARLDLTGLDFTDRSSAVDVSVDVGNLTVLLPPNVDVAVEASVDVGNARVLGAQWNGIGQSERTITDDGADGPGGGRLSLRTTVDVGDLEVRR